MVRILYLVRVLYPVRSWTAVHVSDWPQWKFVKIVKIEGGKPGTRVWFKVIKKKLLKTNQKSICSLLQSHNEIISYHLRITYTKPGKLRALTFSHPMIYPWSVSHRAYEQLWSVQVKTSLHRLPLDLWLGFNLWRILKAGLDPGLDGLGYAFILSLKGSLLFIKQC